LEVTRSARDLFYDLRCNIDQINNLYGQDRLVALMHEITDEPTLCSELLVAMVSVPASNTTIVPAIIAALPTLNPSATRPAMTALAVARTDAAVDHLARATHDGRAAVREQAVYLLGEIGSLSADDAVDVMLHDTSELVRTAARFSLVWHHGDAAVDVLASLARERGDEVREEAQAALASIDSKAARAALRALLGTDLDDTGSR
jgi:hypothetical protein